MRTCEECDGLKWVQVHDRAHRFVARPCSRCKPDQHDKWKRGGYQSHWKTPAGREPSQVEAVTMAKALAEARAHLKSL